MLIKKLFYLALFLLLLGQFTVLGKNSGLNLYLSDLGVFVFATAGVIQLLTKKEFTVNKSSMLFLLFICWAFITLLRVYPLFSTSEFITSAFYLVRLFFYVLSGLVFYNLLKLKIFTPEEFKNILIISGLFIAVTGFVQLVVLPDFEVLDPGLGFDPHKFRLASTFFDPNFAGAFLSISASVILERWLILKKFSVDGYLLSFIIIIAAIVLTFSRSAWLMFGLILFIYGAFKSRKLLIIAMLMAFLAYFAVPRIQTRLSGTTDPSDSAGFRFISWSNALNIINDQPLFGVGFNTFRYTQIKYGYIDAGSTGGNSGAGSDSSILLVAATTGIIGLIIFLTAFLTPAIKAMKNDNLNLAAVIAGLLINSIFINSIFFQQILFLWILLIPVYSFKQDKV